MAAVQDNPPTHLRGNGRPVTEEQTISELKVTGTIPGELDGRYIRNGANPLSGTSDHPFFGDGMLHGVRLRDGRAEWYRNRYVQTPFVADTSKEVVDGAGVVQVKFRGTNRLGDHVSGTTDLELPTSANG